jgi:acyl-CoA thioesterase-2
MDARAFYGLITGDDPGRWQLPVVQELCSGLGALFGGCGLGACLVALEAHTARPTVWATAQYLSYARPGSVLDIDVVEVVRGHTVSQARAIARVGGEEILTVNAALGARDLPLTGEWAIRPDVPPPEECPPRRLFDRHQSTILSRIDMRLANARDMEDFPAAPGDGRAALWVRMPGVLDMSAGALAIVGDYVPFGIGQALGQRAGGNSLDNTLRIASRVPTDWVLADVRVHAVRDGFGHGLVHLWAEDGSLLGTASQSTIVRRWREDLEPTPATLEATR